MTILSETRQFGGPTTYLSENSLKHVYINKWNFWKILWQNDFYVMGVLSGFYCAILSKKYQPI